MIKPGHQEGGGGGGLSPFTCPLALRDAKTHNIKFTIFTWFSFYLVRLHNESVGRTEKAGNWRFCCFRHRLLQKAAHSKPVSQAALQAGLHRVGQGP